MLLLPLSKLTTTIAPTVTRRTPLIGWSITKSVISTLFGMLVDEGLVDIDDPADVAEWAGTPKVNITYNQLLRMESGIRWTESYALVACEFIYVDCAEFYANLQLIHDPGTFFRYSTGSSYLLSRLLEAKRSRALNTFDWLVHMLSLRLLFTRMHMCISLCGKAPRAAVPPVADGQRCD